MAEALGSFTYYKTDADLYLFTVWNVNHTGCGVHSVNSSELMKNIAALELMGYSDRSNQRWNYATQVWE